MLLRFIIGTLLINCSIGVVFAQQARLSGILTDFESGELLEGANVTLYDFDDRSRFFGRATDRNGQYSFNSISPTTYILEMSFLGYHTYRDTLTFEPGDQKTLSIALQFDDVSLGEVVVRGNNTSGNVVELGRQRIAPVDIKRVPSPVAGGDLVNYLLTMPGIVSLGSRGGQVFVRGGTPTENMILVDGALIYKPFHILSFFSPFPDNLIASADFYPGGFNSEYSGRISSVLDIKMRHGDRFRYGGSASISPFAADVLLEGPFQKGKTSWIISAKQSLIEETSAKWYRETQPLKFGSQFAKVSSIKEESQCSAMILNTYDRGEIDPLRDESISWTNTVLGGECQALIEGNFMRMSTSISNLSNTSEHADRSYFSEITQFNSDISVSNYLGNIRMEYGLFWKVEWINYDLEGKITGLGTQKYDLISKGGHVQASIPVGSKLEIEPGISLSHYKPHPVSFEPRLRVTLTPFGEDAGELSGAVGIYRQRMVGITDQRDATGVFVTWTQVAEGNDPVEARHALLGWKQNLPGGFSYSAEAYYKKLYNMPIAVWSAIASFSTDLALADGEVYGADIRLEYVKKNFYGLLGYGYANTTYTSAQDHFNIWLGEPVVSFSPAHDRRHQLNLLASQGFGAFTAGLRWKYSSGGPFTRPLGFDEILWFDTGFPDPRYTHGSSRALLDRPFDARFPSVHSLDVSLEHTYRFSKSPNSASLSTKVGAINLYDRDNIFYFDLFNQRRVNQLPLTLYISFKIDV